MVGNSLFNLIVELDGHLETSLQCCFGLPVWTALNGCFHGLERHLELGFPPSMQRGIVGCLLYKSFSNVLTDIAPPSASVLTFPPFNFVLSPSIFKFRGSQRKKKYYSVDINNVTLPLQKSF